MKKIISAFTVLLILCFSAIPAFAAAPAPQDIQVEITSPSAIDDIPIHEDTIEITVTNNGQTTYQNLSCYLTVIDAGRSQTYPVDEFGENAYQTRTIDSLAPGESTNLSIPVRIMYVGDFRFTASVLDDATGQVFTGSALHVRMTSTSSMNKNLVMTVAVIVPLLLAAAAFWMTRRKAAAK
jgi:uncharacterized membrane protein